MFRSASLFIGTSFTVAVFTIFATSNVDSIVGIPHKIYSMQRILIHIIIDLFVKCAHLHPGYTANLVARSRYYHCHWTLLIRHVYESKWHQLTHWGWVTHICVSKLTIIGSDNVLSPGRRQAIIWTNAGILLIRTLGTNFCEILSKINVVCERVSI